MAKRLTHSYVKSYIESFGYKLLSKEYKTSTTKLDIQCNKGHIYKAKWSIFKQGVRCPYCLGSKTSYQDVKKTIEQAGYKLLSKEYKNNKAKLEIQCNKGHIYKESWSNFKKNPKCSYCSGARITYQDVKETIEKTGYKLLSKKYKNAREKLEIQCDKNHIYTVTWKNFNKGTRCPHCAGLKVTYQEVKDAIGQTGYKLLSKDYKNALDKLEIECDKNHVYKTAWSIFQAGSRCPHCFKLSRFLKYEDIKQLIEEEGYVLLSEKYENNRTKLKIQCDKAHRYEVTWNDFKTGYRCPFCSYEKKAHKYEKVKQTIESNGYILLSKDYKNSTTKLKIQCNKLHVYFATFHQFQSGNKCPYCKGVKTNYAIIKEKIEGRGYKLLSKEYKNCSTKLKIQCNRGHVYETPWRTVQKGCKCPHCVIRGFDPQKPGFLYYIKIKHKTETYYKIGITNTDLKQRFYGISKNVVLLWSESFLFGEYAHQKEQEILIKYKEYLVKENLPFLSSGYTETFIKDVLKKDC